MTTDTHTHSLQNFDPSNARPPLQKAAASADMDTGNLTLDSAILFQHTLARPMGCSGIGLHSGTPIILNLLPAPANHGIVFRRTDIQNGQNPNIRAKWDNVVNTTLCTVLGNNDGVTVKTVEHLMAALAGCGIDNAIIELDGEEVPIMDGSSEPFVFLIECAGLRRQSASLP